MSDKHFIEKKNSFKSEINLLIVIFVNFILLLFWILLQWIINLFIAELSLSEFDSWGIYFIQLTFAVSTLIPVITNFIMNFITIMRQILK